MLILLHSAQLQGAALKVLSSEGPPHTIKHAQHNGIDIDMLKWTLNLLGHQTELHFVGLGRAEKLLKSGGFDVMVPIFMAQDSENFYISDPLVMYRPMVFSLVKNQLSPRSISDLKGHSIITFQGATRYFGEQFAQLSQSEQYREEADMSVIADLLAKDRYDYAVLDRYMFYYFYRQFDKTRSISLFNEHALIAPVSASAAFKSEQIRDQVNALIGNQAYQRQYKKTVIKYLGDIYSLDKSAEHKETAL